MISDFPRGAASEAQLADCSVGERRKLKVPHTQGYRELGNPALGIPGVQARARPIPQRTATLAHAHTACKPMCTRIHMQSVLQIPVEPP